MFVCFNFDRNKLIKVNNRTFGPWQESSDAFIHTKIFKKFSGFSIYLYILVVSLNSIYIFIVNTLIKIYKEKWAYYLIFLESLSVCCVYASTCDRSSVWPSKRWPPTCRACPFYNLITRSAQYIKLAFYHIKKRN